MNYKTWAGLLTIMAVAAIPVTSGEVYAADAPNTEFTVEDFKLHSAQELADVCSIETGSEHYNVAIAFCYGVFEGAVHYDEAISGLAETAAPFLIALAVSWMAWRVWNQPSTAGTGVRVWLTTVVLGMLLRRLVFDDGTATSFVIVATAFLGVFLVGWRGIARALLGRR
jgi:hypothetical protein